MRRGLIIILVGLLPAAMGTVAKEKVYTNPKASSQSRVDDLISRMTLEEKITMVAGDSTGFETAAIPRLGIPSLKMSDGPLGVRWHHSTSFPSGIAMGASFDRDLYRKVSGAMALELRAEGRDMLLGPCVGLSRIPFGGRNFESLGEDPFLTSEMAIAYIHGLHDNHGLATIKHYALNDQEYNRMTINSNADERTMHELHLYAFERAVQDGVDSVMASYNLVNGTYASENDVLLNQILKKRWGFKGFVVSDWGATHSTVPAALAGLDLEMPSADWFDSKLLAAVNAGQVPVSVIDDKVRRILTVIINDGLMDGAGDVRPDLSVINSTAHQTLTLEMAQASQVLLKNDGHVLPLSANSVHKIAVIGPNAAHARFGGGGSSLVQPFYSVSALQGLTDRVGNSMAVSYAEGVQLPVDTSVIETVHFTPAKGEGSGLYGEYFNNTTLTGTPVVTRVDPNIDFYWNDGLTPADQLGTENYSVRWTGKLSAPVTGLYTMKLNADDGVRLWLDGKLVIDDWTSHAAQTDTYGVNLVANQVYDVKIEYYQAEGGAEVHFGWQEPAAALEQQALALAKSSDAVIFAAGFSADLESEGIDRATFNLPAGQDELIAKIAAVNPHTVVVINTGNPVSMDAWLSKVPAVIYSWYPGQEGGHALADVLLGRVNPSGRLPITMIRHWEDAPEYGTYPEQNGSVNYSEGIHLGYRHFDQVQTPINFAFGHGLSYTTFFYSGLKISPNNSDPSNPDIDVTMTVMNTGAMEGNEVVQLYVHDQQPQIDRPFQELKGFEKIDLKPGESRQVTMKLDKMSFAYYDVTTHGWKAPASKFTIRVGASSRDIRLAGDVELKPANVLRSLVRGL